MSHLLSKVEECWGVVKPQDHWQAWLARNERLLEEGLVKGLLGNIDEEFVLDIGCGSGRYAHCLSSYDLYVGVDIWKPTVEYARVWASSRGLKNTRFESGGIFDFSAEQKQYKPSVVLTMNVMRHFKDPLAGYQWVWDFLPEGCMWVTDFLTHAGYENYNDGDFSTVIPGAHMYKFLEGKKHSEPFTWLNEVGDWYLSRIQK